jgi:hypothetical protein
MADKLTAAFDNLGAGVIQVVDLEADMMQARTARREVFAQMGFVSEWPDDFKPDAAVAFKIIRRYILIVDFLKSGWLDSEKLESFLARLKVGCCPGNMLEARNLDHSVTSIAAR